MRRIANYRKVLGVTPTADLQELKSTYRGLMKEWHPDKFHGDEEKLAVAEAKSKELINAYHFLVSIAPETIEQAAPQYAETVNTSPISNFSYEKEILKIEFADGSSYEYFGVSKNVYNKLCNSDIPSRFCRRHIYHEFVYRKMSKAVEA